MRRSAPSHTRGWESDMRRLFLPESLFRLKRPCFLHLWRCCCGCCGCCGAALASFATGSLRERVTAFCRIIRARGKSEHARERACKDKHQPASQPPTPAHPRHMPSPAFMSFAQTFDWSQQASEGSLFTSPQQVNILHLASSSWKSERREDGASSFMAANSVCVCMNEARRWRPAAPCKKAGASRRCWKRASQR